MGYLHPLTHSSPAPGRDTYSCYIICATTGTQHEETYGAQSPPKSVLITLPGAHSAHKPW